MAVQPIRFYSEEEYLALEREAEYKSEYINGQIYAMAGATRIHNLITGNVAAELRNRLRERSCETYSSDMKVRVQDTGMYTYPDVLVVCGDPEWANNREDTLLNPLLVVEVLSPSTESYDRGEKFAHYRRLESLQEYVLIAQDRCRVERYVRRVDAPHEWILTEFSDPAGEMPFASLGVSLPLSEVYARVTFETAALPSPLP